MSGVVESLNAKHTEAIASYIAEQLVGGETLLLNGELGAGKTCFVRGLCAGLGLSPRQVKSPSYNILHHYEGGRLEVQHFDAYFVREEGEFSRAGLDEFLALGHVAVVEWAERFPGAFSPQAIRIDLEVVSEDCRRLTIQIGRNGEDAAIPAPEGEWLRRLEVDAPALKVTPEDSSSEDSLNGAQD